MGMVSTFIVSLFLTLPHTLLAQSTDPLSSKENQLEIIINDSSYNSKTREMVYIAGRLAYLKERYELDPESFRVDVQAPPLADSSLAITRIPDFDTVVKDEMNRMQADGFISKDLSSLELGNDLVGLIPHPVAIQISGSIGVLLKHTNTEGEPPAYFPGAKEYENLGGLIYTLSQDESELGKTIRSKFKELVGYDIMDDLSKSKPIERVKEQSTEEARHKEYLKLIQQTNLTLDELIKINSDLQKENIDEARKQQLAIAYEQKRQYLIGEVAGSLELMGTVANIFGDSESARKFVAISKATTMIATVFSPESKSQKGTMAMANVYVAAAMMVVQAFQSDAKADQMRALMEAIENLRKEMHERFDIVDTKLDMLQKKMSQGFTAILNNQGRLQDNIALLSNALEDHRIEVNEKLQALYARITSDKLNLCLDVGFNLNKPVSEEKFDECLVLIRSNLFEYSRFSYDALSEGPNDLSHAAYESLLFPYSSSLWPLVNSLRDNYQIDLPNPQTIYNVILWNKSAQNLIQLWELHPQWTTTPGDKPIHDAILSGENIKDLMSSLALEKETLKVNKTLFRSILLSYTEKVSEALSLIDSFVRKNDHQLHPGLSTDQNLDLVGAPQLKNNSIKACKSATEWGVRKVSYMHYFIGGMRPPQETVYTPNMSTGATGNWNPWQMQMSLSEQPPELPLWNNISNSLPNELLWLEKINPGTLTVCFREFKFDHLTYGHLTPDLQNDLWNKKTLDGLRYLKADFKVIIEVQIGDPIKPSVEGQTVLVTNINRSITIPWNYRIRDPERIHFNRPALYSIFWSGRDHIVDKTYHLPGLLENVWSDNDTRWGDSFQKKIENYNTVVMSLQNMLNRLKPTMILNTQNEIEFKKLQTSIADIRNTLIVLLEIGLNQNIPGRLPAYLLLSNKDDSQSIRDLNTILNQITNGDYKKEDILEQIELSKNQFLEQIDIMNDSGFDLRPTNPTLERTLFDLNSLLRQ